MTPRRSITLLLLALLAGCAMQQRPSTPAPRPEQVRATIERMLPPGSSNRAPWAQDIAAAFAALRLEPSPENLCAAVAVIGQESGFQADPAVSGLGRIARKEIDTRAARLHVPKAAVAAALKLKSPDGRSWGARIEGVRTERELSETWDALIGSVPLGERLFAGINPVRTGGPMQVSIAFAEAHAGAYPYPVASSIRDEVFTRRGGVYFGIAHLLDYPADYDRLLYRYADYNAGRYASRNAAFQNAVSLASGIPLALDGDLVAKGRGATGPTEVAVRALRLPFSDRQIRRALEREEEPGFSDDALYEAVFAHAEASHGKPLPRAMVPKIRLESPKITRELTTVWFANRVETRHGECMQRVAAPPARKG